MNRNCEYAQQSVACKCFLMCFGAMILKYCRAKWFKNEVKKNVTRILLLELKIQAKAGYSIFVCVVK